MRRKEGLTKKYLIILNYDYEELIFYIFRYILLIVILYENMNITLIRLSLII